MEPIEPQGAGLSLLGVESKFLIFTNQIAQFIITSFPDFPIFRIFGFRTGIPQVGFLGVCLGFSWGVMSQCLGTYDLRCLLGDLILFCLGMNFSSGFQGLICLGTSVSAPLLLGDLLGSVRQGRLNVVPPFIEVKYVLKYPLDPKSEIRVIQ